MRLYADSQEQAQDFADRAHAYLLADENDAAYARSAQAGQTARWAVPSRDVDEDGSAVGDWYIPVELRCLGAFTEKELARLDPPLPEPSTESLP